MSKSPANPVKHAPSGNVVISRANFPCGVPVIIEQTPEGYFIARTESHHSRAAGGLTAEEAIKNLLAASVDS